MPVVVHLRNGRNEQVHRATSCTWIPTGGSKSGSEASPRWLVCHDARGHVVATFDESGVLGFRAEKVKPIRRFKFPSLGRKVAT
jgi:hypothetical protein